MSIDIALFRARIGIFRLLKLPIRFAKTRVSIIELFLFLLNIIFDSYDCLSNNLGLVVANFAKLFSICLFIAFLPILLLNSHLSHGKKSSCPLLSTKSLYVILLDSIIVSSFISFINRSLLISSGSVELNPGPKSSKVSFATWNIDSHRWYQQILY